MARIRASHAVLAGLFAFAFALRLYGLDDKPLWLDEIITWGRSGRPVADLTVNALSNRHFPTYFALIKLFHADDAWLLRLPSAFFGSVCVVLVAMIATRVHSARAGLVAGLLMALSPFDVQFSQEARPYAVVSCFILIALWGLVRIAGSLPPAGSTPDRDTRARNGWMAYTLGTAVALYLHLVATAWLVASNVAVLLVATRRPRPDRAFVRAWLRRQAIILVIWLPGLAAMLLLRSDPGQSLRWLPPFSLQHLRSLFSSVYLFRIADVVSFELLPTLAPGFGAVVLILAAAGAWQLRRQPVLLSVCGIAAIALPVLVLAVSLVQPILIPRYLSWSTGPYVVLAGVGLAALPRRAFAIATVALLAGGVAALTPYYRSETKPRWDLAARYLAQHLGPSDIVVTPDPMAVYVLRRYGAWFRLDPSKVKAIADPAELARYAGESAVWVAYGRSGQGTAVPEADFRARWLAADVPVSTVRLGRHVALFELPRRNGAN